MLEEKQKSQLQALVTEQLGNFGIAPEEVMAIKDVLINNPKIIKKGELFCKEGKESNSMGILLSGLLYAYYETEKSTHQVSRFFHASCGNIIVSSFDSFSRKTPSIENIEALEDSYLLCITSNELEDLYARFPNLNKVGRLFIEESYIKALNISHSKVLPAEQKVRNFMDANKELYNLLKKKDIASYLGMTPKRFREVLKIINL